MPVTGGRVEWVNQPDAVLAQAAAVQNTWYVLLPATGRYTKIIEVFMMITVANETLEIETTVDGLVKTGTIAATFNQDYQLRHGTTTVADTWIPVAALTYSLLDYNGHDIQIRLRKTTANGAGTLYGKVIYALA